MSSSKLSNLSWAELRDRARRIGRRWSSEELPTGNATTAEEQLSVAQVNSGDDGEVLKEHPSVEELSASVPPEMETMKAAIADGVAAAATPAIAEDGEASAESTEVNGAADLL
ncbi:unnamed protein product [Linum trigynum]|uniref:Uncharacterized protein n=1 Tax=Linum trigynum TaxID=586398 RepID=A0AAV2F5T9_9ROSI